MSWYSGPIRGICEGIFDGPHATPKESDDGPIFLGISNVTTDGRMDLSEIRHVSEQEFPRWTRRVLPRFNDIVFSYEATLHRYVLIPDGFRGCLGRRMGLVRVDQDKVDPRYLLYYFLSPQWRSVIEGNIINGATVDRIPLTNLPDFPIRIPPRDQQTRIADALTAYDDLIENNRRRIGLLEEAARLLYREWFVYFRFPGHQHVKMTNGLPEGWVRKPFGEIAQLQYGKALKEEKRLDGSFPVYGSSGIVGTHQAVFVEGPAIVVGRKGNVGSIYWSPIDFWPIDTVYFVSKEQSDYWLYHSLPIAGFQNTDAGVPGLNRDFAYSRKLTYPSERLRRSFNEVVAPMFEQRTTLESYNQKLALVRDLLLPRLINGEIAV